MMNSNMGQYKKMVVSMLFLVGFVACFFYTRTIDQPGEINPLTQSQVVMQGHSSLQIEDSWYKMG